MRNRYKGTCEVCKKTVLPKQGRWRLEPKLTQDFTGLRCLKCSNTTIKARKQIKKL